ncbi:MAG: hypothetical protein KTR32_44055 [Granulosicoccus sp.]|nr:hypothetical protein [Granulosicoccus sp.]
MATAQRANKRSLRNRSLVEARQRGRFHRLGSNLAALIVGAGLILFFQWVTPEPRTIALTSQGQDAGTVTLNRSIEIPAPQGGAHISLEEAAYAEVPAIEPASSILDEFSSHLLSEELETLRPKLLELAVQAVRDNDNARLANTLMLLGVAALTENNTDSANVYLQEALAVFEEIGDEVGSANVHLQIGRMHLIDRRIARRAALAYDSGLLARLKISSGEFHEASHSLHRAINENIELKRYGAAARDYETLSQGYLEHGQWDEAAETAIEAAKLHASSGRLKKARGLLQGLVDTGVVDIDIDELNRKIIALHADYEDSVEQIGRARDYQQLYHHFIAEGDPVRAWQFRLQADASLKKVSKRARYRRQAGVLVLLYNSNDSMRKARDSLTTAHATFTQQSLEGLAIQSESLLKEVY